MTFNVDQSILAEDPKGSPIVWYWYLGLCRGTSPRRVDGGDQSEFLSERATNTCHSSKKKPRKSFLAKTLIISTQSTRYVYLVKIIEMNFDEIFDLTAECISCFYNKHEEWNNSNRHFEALPACPLCVLHKPIFSPVHPHPAQPVSVLKPPRETSSLSVLTRYECPIFLYFSQCAAPTLILTLTHGEQNIPMNTP